MMTKHLSLTPYAGLVIKGDEERTFSMTVKEVARVDFSRIGKAVDNQAVRDVLQVRILPHILIPYYPFIPYILPLHYFLTVLGISYRAMCCVTGAIRRKSDLSAY